MVRKPVKRTARPDVLLVCRANRARSPVAAELFRDYLEDQGLEPMPVVISSGLYAVRGQPLLSTMQAALTRKKHVEIDHRSKPFSLKDANAARIVITFEREFTRTIVTQNPALVPRTFTLREIRRLTSSDRWDPAWNGDRDVPAKLHLIRPLVEPGDDDTPDPIGGRRWAVRKVLDGIVSDVAAVAPILFGTGPGHSVADPDAP